MTQYFRKNQTLDVPLVLFDALLVFEECSTARVIQALCFCWLILNLTTSQNYDIAKETTQFDITATHIYLCAMNIVTRTPIAASARSHSMGQIKISICWTACSRLQFNEKMSLGYTTHVLYQKSICSQHCIWLLAGLHNDVISPETSL